MHKYGINMLYVLKAELNALRRKAFFEHLVREDKCVVFLCPAPIGQLIHSPFGSDHPIGCLLQLAGGVGEGC
jgi:hypothetical protein